MLAKLFALLLLVCVPVARVWADGIVSPAVDSVARRYLADSPLVGFGVTVVRNGTVVHDAGYGRARISPPLSANERTRFDYFSVGKHVTTALVLRLVERGVLDLDAPAGRYLPELDTLYAELPLRRLLNHTSGVVALEIDESKPAPEHLRAPTRASLLALLAKGQRVAPPGVTWIYCSDAFVVAAMIAEQVTGSSYRELVRRELAEPLGLDDFGFQIEPHAQGYLIEEETPAPIQAVPYEWFSGAGSIRGTTRDLARWWLALRGGRVLSDRSMREMLKPVRLADGGRSTEFGYGLGIRLGRYQGHRIIGHTGDAAGGSAVLVEYPDDGLLIVVATNTRGNRVPFAIEVQAAIARALLSIRGGPHEDRAASRAQLRSYPGLYVSPGGSFCVTARDESLFVSRDGEAPARLMHQGDGVFRRRAVSAGVEEYFLGGPGTAQWFAYRWYGYPMDVAIRRAPTCP